MKRFRLIFLILTTYLVIVLLSSCTISSMNQVVEMKYVAWKAERPDIFFRTLDSSGDGFGYVTIDGEKKEAYIYFEYNRQMVIQLINRELPMIGDTKERCYINLTYKGGVMTSVGDSVVVFGAEYEQITFVKSEFDRDTIDASEYFGVSWSDADKRLTFNIIHPSALFFAAEERLLSKAVKKKSPLFGEKKKPLKYS